MARILAAELADRGVKVNSMCPGWCRTDLGGPDAPRSPEQCMDTVIWLATLPDVVPPAASSAIASRFRGSQAIK